ncbi:MAG TPA: 6-phosphogluconolactonase, partial [Thermoanaerobaculia bacterium]|nr:6-phosphogluconolactonase [Thermoanaerobaculia bacterium]
SAIIDERARWVVSEYVPAASMWRITLTAPLLNASAEILFLVSGSAKAGVLEQVLEGPRKPHELPAQLIVPTHGRIQWLVDSAAAAELETIP